MMKDEGGNSNSTSPCPLLDERVPSWRRAGAWAVFAVLLIGGLLLWARGRDPFVRQWHTVRVPGGPAVSSVAVLPKTASRPMPVVVYFHGSGGSVVGSGNDLRAIAELGIAAVGMDYCQTNEAVFERQFTALIEHVGRQPWADKNRIAWLGYSLGAQRQLSYVLRHPEQRPAMLVRLGGGMVPELEITPEAQTKHTADLTGGSRGSGDKEIASVSRSTIKLGQFPLPETAIPPHPALSPGRGSGVLIVHGEHDEIFPLEQARQVEAILRSNAVPVELKVLKGRGHSLGEERMVIFRQLGEDCLVALKGEDAFRDYRSILDWQRAALPLWVWLLPVAAFGCLWQGCIRLCSHEANEGNASEKMRLEDHAKTQRRQDGKEKFGSRCRLRVSGVDRAVNRLLEKIFASWRLSVREIFLAWFVALLLAIAAGLQAGVHLILPRLEASSRTVALARKFLVQRSERPAFDHLAALPIWKGKQVGSMVEHAHLAQYNRQIINWQIDEAIYRDYVLDPRVNFKADGALDWRRTLWESCYPRIRREERAEAAAEVIQRHLRERVTIRDGEGWPSEISDIWQRQITNPTGFEALCAAALRSCGVPARLNAAATVEVWDGTRWRSQP